MSRILNWSGKGQRAGGHPHAAEKGNKRHRYATQNAISGRYFSLLLSFLLVWLVACGTGSSETAVSSTATPASEPIPAPTEAETAETRTFTDAMGREVTIPVAPQRVVALSEIDLDSLVALGIIPVGASNGRGQTTLPTYLLPMIEGKTTSIGQLGEPNLETILTLEPDLIVYSDPYGPLAEKISELEQIAPVIVPYVDNGDWHWKTVFLAVADAVGKSAEAQAWMQTYDEQTAVLGSHLSDDMREVSIVRWMADGPRILLSNAFPSQVLSDIGFVRPAYQIDLAGAHPVHTDVISMEQVDLVDADIIFAGGLNPEGDTAMQEALEDPLVQTLSAIQAERLFLVDGLAWSSTGGPTAAMHVLNDVANALGVTIDSTETAVSPFPVTIEHKFGSITIPATPERVVVIGYNDQDSVLALGITPLAVRYWFGDTENAIFPWAQDALVGENPAVLNMPFGELNYELILSFNPDLIVAVYAGITAEEYDLLAQIAPTLAQTADYNDYGMPWQEATRLIGTAVGKTAEAEALVAGVEATFADARASHPEFAGKSFVVATGRATGGYAFFSTQDPRTRYFTNLGFAPPTDLDELTGGSFYAEISAERLDLLDRDLIIFTQASYLENGADSILNDPLLGQLDAMKEGRFVILTEALDGAFSFSSVLSLGYVTQELVPQLAAALGEPAESAALFPVTIEHKFGSTTIPAAPERVITIGYSEQDAVLALGVVPVAVRDWFGEQPYGVWPWAQDELGGATPELLQMPYGELNYELITSLSPDLLVATHSGITEEEYNLLSQIAPTLAQPADYPDFGVPWQVQTQLIGRALGREALANELVAAVEEQITAVSESNNGFGGATVAWVTPAADAGQFWVVGETTPPLRFLTGLGLTYDPALSEVVGDLDSAQISNEQLGLLDVDVLIVRAATPEEQAAILSDPLFSQLSVVQDGRIIFFVGNDPVYGALSFSTVLSLPYALEGLVPQLKTAVEQ